MTSTQHDYLTTRELADLLRVKERKIYDLAAAGEVPCRRITGKLLFPRHEIEAWIDGEQNGATQDQTPIVAGSHDPLLDWALREGGTGLGSFFDGSLDGIERLADGRAMMAGAHIFEGEGRWNQDLVQTRFAGKPVVRLHWAKRQQGLIIPKGSGIRSMADLASKRITLRQSSAGARLLFDHFSTTAGLTSSDYTVVGEVRTETEAATDVAAGKADAAFGLEAVAGQFDLGFLPLVKENFDLIIHQRAYFLPGFQALWPFCRRPVFADKAKDLGGYDLSDHGAVGWVGP